MQTEAKLIGTLLSAHGWQLEKETSSNRTFYIAKRELLTNGTKKKAQAYIESCEQKIRLSGYHWNVTDDLMILQSKKLFDPSNFELVHVERSIKQFINEIRGVTC